MATTSNFAKSLLQAEHLLTTIQDELLKEASAVSVLEALLSQHEALLKHLCSGTDSLSNSQVEDLKKHLQAMQVVVTECEKGKDDVSLKLGSIKRSEKIKKAYGI
ncbi:hypothetical protein [Agarivorans aestuarii]|uniref:hypothetical protein n=1 Tax=Agarivorans aestuarii TaxID=1563703 RepID=UPI001C7FF34D|nr:hypothetical protein [Agarivorans aestuarii]